MKKTILMIGAFDTKGLEYAFLRDRIISRGHRVLTVNTGVLGETDLFPVDVPASTVAGRGDSDLALLRSRNDRGEAMRVMSIGAPKVVAELHAQGKFDGIIGMGGTGGTSVITAAMQALPVGVPKVCVSTAASGNTADYVRSKDIVLFPSIVDVAGLNRISRLVFSGAADAVCGMVEGEPVAQSEDRPIIAASMFGNTTECVNACASKLDRSGYEVLVFHATGTGGRTMESLVDEGLVSAVLDITTTEWADTICGGVFDAGPDRLSAPGRAGIPHLIVPGCVDMANFGGPESVPERYRKGNRTFYEWNPSVTLMRTNTEENRKMGEIFAEKANLANGPVAFLLPLRGVSIVGKEGGPFHDPAADAAIFDAIRQNVRRDIPVIEVDSDINSAEFANEAVRLMLQLIEKGKARPGAAATGAA